MDGGWMGGRKDGWVVGGMEGWMDASSEKNILGYDTYFLHSLEKGFPTKL